MGIKDLTEYFVNQVQEVYRLQGNNNDKHIETILRQMLKKVEIKSSGDSSYLPGEIVDRIKFENMNDKLKSENKTPAIGERVLMGITKASLQTESLYQQPRSKKQLGFSQMLLLEVKLIL